MKRKKTGPHDWRIKCLILGLKHGFYGAKRQNYVREWRIKCLIFNQKYGFLVGKRKKSGPHEWRIKCLFFSLTTDFKVRNANFGLARVADNVSNF